MTDELHGDPRYRHTLRAMERAFQLADQFMRELPSRPVSRMAAPAEMASTLDEPLPEEPSDPVAAVTEWMDRADAGIIANPGPRFFGFVNGGVTPGALAGDWLASTIDQNAALWVTSPAAAQTEMVVIRWLKELFGLPAEWHGLLTSGATMSNVICLAAARQWASGRLGFDAAVDGLAGHPPIHVVSSSAIHASAIKALGTLGLGRSSVIQIPTTDGTMDLDRLRERMEVIDGPVILIANAGEVNSGQFDDLNAMADVRDQHPGGAWLHVDAAFGLFAAATPAYQDRVAGIDRTDSVASDAHKWLNVPYDAGFVFVRDESVLRSAFATPSAYLTRSGGFDADNYGPEFSRRFRALPAWCSLKSLGRHGYQEMIERCIANARLLASWIDARPEMELLNADRQRQYPFNVVCFRYVSPDLTSDEIDAFNLRAVDALQRDGRAFVSGTRWNGVAGIRAAFVNWSTEAADVDILQQALLDVGSSHPRA